MKDALAEVLSAVAAAAQAAAPSHIGHGEGELIERLDALRNRRDELAALLLVDPHIDPAAWQQHGALLAAIDRLRVEIAAVGRPVEHGLAPARSADRYQAIRRAPADRHSQRTRRF
jgi:hypothetical protein